MKTQWISFSFWACVLNWLGSEPAPAGPSWEWRCRAYSKAACTVRQAPASPPARQRPQQGSRPLAVRCKHQDLGRGRAPGQGLELAEEAEEEGAPAGTSVRGRVRGREVRTGGWVAEGTGRTEVAEGPARGRDWGVAAPVADWGLWWEAKALLLERGPAAAVAAALRRASWWGWVASEAVPGPWAGGRGHVVERWVEAVVREQRSRQGAPAPGLGPSLGAQWLGLEGLGGVGPEAVLAPWAEAPAGAGSPGGGTAAVGGEWRGSVGASAWRPALLTP